MDDKYVDQARSYKPVDDFKALPLAGPGRWAEIPGGLLYTNDDDVLFLRGESSIVSGHVIPQV